MSKHKHRNKVQSENQIPEAKPSADTVQQSAAAESAAPDAAVPEEKPKGLVERFKAWNAQRIADNTPPPGFDFNARPHLPQREGQGDHVNFADVALREDELRAAEIRAGKANLNFFGKLLLKYIRFTENRERHRVKKSTYIWLCLLLGWCGAHRFYEKRWKLGIFYALVGWTGFGFALALVDWMIVAPMKADEDGMIEI